MKANELRIGNWYNWRGGDAPDEGYNEQLLLNDYAELERNPQRFRPIPLTEEWLLKFGFEKYMRVGDNYYHKEGFNNLADYGVQGVILKSKPNEYTHMRCGYYKNEIICEYVHSLQNLYFALTGEEID